MADPSPQCNIELTEAVRDGGTPEQVAAAITAETISILADKARFQRDYYDRGAPKPPRDDAAPCIAWLTKDLAATATHEIVQDDLCPDDPMKGRRVRNLALCMCDTLGWPRSWGATASESAVHKARLAYDTLCIGLAARVRRLAYERSPGHLMLKVVNDETQLAGVCWPYEHVLDFCKRIAESTVDRPRRGGK